MTRARKSYVGSDILWHKNFATIFGSREDGTGELVCKRNKQNN